MALNTRRQIQMANFASVLLGPISMTYPGKLKLCIKMGYEGYTLYKYFKPFGSGNERELCSQSCLLGFFDCKLLLGMDLEML